MTSAQRILGGSRTTGRASPAAAPDSVKFAPADRFHRELRRRVAQYFQATGKRPRDCPRMYLKTALILGWFAASYVALVFFAETWPLALALAVSLGLAMAA